MSPFIHTIRRVYRTCAPPNKPHYASTFLKYVSINCGNQIATNCARETVVSC